MDKDRGGENVALVESFIKPRDSTIFGRLTYSLDGPVPPIAVSGPQEEFLNSVFRIWVGGKLFYTEALGQSGYTKYGKL